MEAFGVRWQAERDTALGCGRGTGCADEKAPSPLRSAGALQNAGALATVARTSVRLGVRRRCGALDFPGRFMVAMCALSERTRTSPCLLKRLIPSAPYRI